MDIILNWVSTYGYAAVYCLLVLGIVGLPVPDETMLVFSGYLVWRGNMSAIPLVLVAFAGSCSGISISYWIGRTLGIGFVHKWGRYVHLTEARLERVHAFFRRAGHWTLFFGYFIAGVRHFTAVVAGTSSLEYRTFAAYAYTGAFVWVCTFVGLGYYFGEHWQQMMAAVEKHVHVVSIALIVVVALVLAVRWYRNRAR
jgi:membrane protein DedA with SNARE-associated domain